jgi:hypothetical protein
LEHHDTPRQHTTPHRTPTGSSCELGLLVTLNLDLCANHHTTDREITLTTANVTNEADSEIKISHYSVTTSAEHDETIPQASFTSLAIEPDLPSISHISLRIMLSSLNFENHNF